jgi:sec-independent protein translocase protein TatA
METLAFYNNPWAWAVLIVVLLLFGGQKIPEMMRGLGRGMKEFKQGMNEMDDDELRKDREKEERIRAEVEREVRARMEKEQNGSGPARKAAERELDEKLGA